ncbi:MAG: EamA family transporter [Nitrospinota bacterium]|nr:EamA family transporter [Nitrospinota bacterium]
MELFPLGLVLISALLHASWNYFAKGNDDPPAMIWCVMTASLLVYAPIFLNRLPGARFAPDAWIYILATGILHAFYISTLGIAYQTGELSKVYPLARGSAPLMTAGTAALFLGERISPAGGLAIFLVVGGIFVSHLEPGEDRGWRLPFRRGSGAAVRWALATGMMTALYSVVDKVGVTRVSPEIYIYLMFILTCLLLAPVYLTGSRAALVRSNFKDGKSIFHVLLAGAFMMGSYGLLLFALQMSKVSYVVAVRGVSVILAAGLGVFLLKESGQRQKLIGAALVAAGLVILALTR